MSLKSLKPVDSANSCGPLEPSRFVKSGSRRQHVFPRSIIRSVLYRPGRASPCALRERSMACRVRMRESIKLIRRLLPTVVFLVGIGSQGEASTASISTATSRDFDDHAEYCKCRNCSRESCCCGPRKDKARTSPPLQASGSPSTTSVPCMNPAPCSQPGLPSASTAGPSGTDALLAPRCSLLSITSGRHLPLCPLCILPVRRASRIEEPPEGMAIA